VSDPTICQVCESVLSEIQVRCYRLNSVLFSHRLPLRSPNLSHAYRPVCVVPTVDVICPNLSVSYSCNEDDLFLGENIGQEDRAFSERPAAIVPALPILGSQICTNSHTLQLGFCVPARLTDHPQKPSRPKGNPL
jgi:hypothetical protein